MPKKKRKRSGQTPTNKHDAVFHFTVGSLPTKGSGPRGGFFDFKRELGPLKAALLYADRITLCSVGASFMHALDDFHRMSLNGKLALIHKYLPEMYPGATPAELEQTYQVMKSVKTGRVRGGSGRPGAQKMFAGRNSLDKNWSLIEDRVQQEYSGVDAEGFREALQSGLVKVQPFRNISAEKIMDMGMAADRGTPGTIDADETYQEYRDQILAAVKNAKTYPLFDDQTGNIVGKAVRNRLISPSQGAVARSRHGGLSGDILQRLPLFERAEISDVLEIRRELSDHLNNFREAVAQFAEAVGPASWDEDFAEEAARVFREKIVPAVDRIERAVKDDRDLRELTWRFGPPLAGGTIPALGAFMGSTSVMAQVALLAAGLTVGGLTGAALGRTQRRQRESNQLYFYYHAGQRLRGLGRRP